MPNSSKAAPATAQKTKTTVCKPQNESQAAAWLFHFYPCMNIEARFLLLILLLAAWTLPGCAATADTTPLPQPTGLSRDIPTWTPRPADLTAAPPTPPRPATVTPSPSAAPTATPSPVQVTVQAIGGNLHLRRGPSVDYNSIGVLRAGQTLTATGRDAVSRWLQVPLPAAPGKWGWVSILTSYSRVNGEVEDLPIVTISPALPAFIRNCTKHRMLVLPSEVELLDKYEEPYNEERFPPGEYQVYDLEAGDEQAYQTIILWEGKRVDIQEDGLGEKSKCE